MTQRIAPTSTGTPGQIRVTAATGDKLRELEGETAVGRLPDLLRESASIVWVDLTSPSPEQVSAVGAAMGLHPLIIEDVLEGNQRAKIESTDGVVHLVLFALKHDERFIASEIDMVLGLGFLLTVHDQSWDPRATHHLRNSLASIMADGADHLLWSLADDVVDGYFPFADELGEALDAVQDAVIGQTSPEALEQLFTLKRELIEVRRAASPTREVFNQLTNRDLPLIDEHELVYFRDIYDHVIRLTDELDNYRELASSTLDVYLTQVNNNLSIIVKRLTGVTVILAGIGALAGLFGMSEAAVEVGSFWLVAGTIVALAGVAALVLRKIDWL
ncbi:MAG: magnesium transporter CorA family protein [Candidatus Limnocylindrales bacterium]